MTQLTLFPESIRFADRRTADVTFKGKLTLPIHRWYRLTPSFSPQLAMDIADHFGITPNDFVLDPFSGVGTVPLCMKYRGIPACSIEINPYLHFVSTVKTRTYRDLPDIREFFDSFLVRTHEEVRTIPKGTAVNAYLVANAQYVPPIHKPQRWWSPGNLAQLTCIRRLLLHTDDTGEHIDLLKMGILGILVPVSNARHNHVSLTFAKEPLRTVDVVGALADKLLEITQDIDEMAAQPSSEVTVFAGNSKQAASILAGSPKVSAVITSPPYPNRFSYARETRPHLFFFNYSSHRSPDDPRPDRDSSHPRARPARSFLLFVRPGWTRPGEASVSRARPSPSSGERSQLTFRRAAPKPEFVFDFLFKPATPN